MSGNDEEIWFPHHSLDAHKLAMRVALAAKRLAAKVPRGHRTLADHWLRAAGQTVLLVAEGASRFNAGEKRQRYMEARGESGEGAAACEVALLFEFVDAAEGRAYLADAARLGSVLTGLIRKFGGIPEKHDEGADEALAESESGTPGPRPLSSSDSDSVTDSASMSASVSDSESGSRGSSP
jgi:four helix bundle protein